MHKHHENEKSLIECKLSDLEVDLHKIIKGMHRMSIEVDNLTAQVKSNSDAIDSAIALINGIADRITAAGVDPVKLKSLTDELKSKDEALSTAVFANTPQAPVA